jgi:hypothetical protein
MFENIFADSGSLTTAQQYERNSNAAASLQGAGAITSAIGAWGVAKSQKYALGAQATINGINAHLAELSAQSAMLAGQRQASGVLLRTGELKGTQRATMAANGIDISEAKGTSQDIQNSTDFMGQTDANTLNANAVARAWGFRTEATNYTNQATMTRAQGEAINPALAAGTSLLGSAGGIASSWYYRKMLPSAGGSPTIGV